MANKDEKKFYKTYFFICSSFIFGPLGALISWLILKFQKNKKLKNKQNEEQLLEKLALLKNNNLENDDSKDEINNQKLVEFYKNILAEFDTLFSKQSKDVPDVKNQNTQTTVGSNQILEQSKTNDLLREIMRVKNNLRKVEPKPRIFTNRIIPNPTIKPNLSNWQKEQIKSVNEQLNSIEHENENNKNIDENTR
ncbi:hypothetical protein [Spiroplasma endosymbiont of Ammophila pubescens]|uniref:hypothetical protein n=1 Tax=Spiroplasma endosymbiont of Ammophila pubescens TaxID=3066315 RepID=UPI0032B28D9A